MKTLTLPQKLRSTFPALTGDSPGEYATAELRAAQAENSVQPYLRPHHPVCREFLRLGSLPQELPAVRVFFPFVREAAVLQIPVPHGRLANWLYFAFLAGHNLGAAQPDLLDEVLPDHEAGACRGRLHFFQKLTRETHLSGRGLHYAFEQIVERQWPRVSDAQLPAVLAETALKALRTGFAAATLAHTDPILCEFLGEIPHPCTGHFPDIVWKAHLGAPLTALHQPLALRLEHPLLKLARELYPGRPTERDNVLAFLQAGLQSRRVTSENTCPTEDTDLPDWLLAAMAYAQRVQRERPEIVERILAEASPPYLQDSLTVVRRVIGGAASVVPEKLLPRLSEWMENVYGWKQPDFYGRGLARLAYFADFAMWIPWVLALDRGRPHSFVFVIGQPPLSNHDELPPPPPDVKQEIQVFPPSHAPVIRRVVARQLRQSRATHPRRRLERSEEYAIALRVLRTPRKLSHPDFQ